MPKRLIVEGPFRINRNPIYTGMALAVFGGAFLWGGPASLIVGARAPIQHVGISNFRLPIRYQTRAGGEITLETSVTGTVSLEADRKGINMSRIMRSFYAHADKRFSMGVLAAALDAAFLPALLAT